jgi:hypothetical protein
MVCLRNISVDTLHKGDTEDDDDDDDDDDNNNNDRLYAMKKEGGRGLVKVEVAYKAEITGIAK